MSASTDARANANRANARLSTGPRTKLGKARVAQNALRHGLSTAVASDLAFSAEITRFAHLLAGAESSPQKFDAACRVVEAQIDLRRVRQARLKLLTDPRERLRKLPIRILRSATKQIMRRADRDGSDFAVDEAFEEMECLINGDIYKGRVPALEDSMDVIAPKLMRLDRYERRTLSRRKFAIRAWDAFVRTEGQGGAPSAAAPEQRV